jgi:hypothetical protein
MVALAIQCQSNESNNTTVHVAKTFVGTAQYVAPELLEASETSKR